MIKNLIAITALLLATRIGFGMDILSKTYMCDTENTVTVNGVTCCLDQFSESECDSIVNSQLDSTTLTRTNNVIDMIMAGNFEYKSNPNCHWNAMAYHLESFQNEITPYVDLMGYEKQLSEQFIEVSIDEVIKGDVIVYYEYDIKDKMMVETGGRPRMKWVNTPGETISHSAIYLTDGVVFQKENLDSAVFSIANIDHVNEMYRGFANQKSYMHQAKMKYRVFRKL